MQLYIILLRGRIAGHEAREAALVCGAATCGVMVGWCKERPSLAVVHGGLV